LAPFLEIAGLALFFKTLSCVNTYKKRMLVGYLFALASTLLIYNGFWLGIIRLTNFSLPANILSFLLLAIPQYLHLILISILFSRLVFFGREKVFVFWSAFAVFEWYNPGTDTMQIGQTWIELTPHLNLAPIFGLPIYTLFSSCLAWMIFRKTNIKLIAAIVIVFFALNFRNEIGVQKGSKILMVQTNHEPFSILRKKIGQAEALKKIEDSLTQATGDINSINSPFVVFAESTIPYPLNPNMGITPQIAKISPFKKLLDKGITIGFGAPTIGTHDRFERYFNSFYVLKPDLIQRYDKRVLMPLAESPLPVLGEAMTSLLLNRKDYVMPGLNIKALSLNPQEKFLVDICLDGVVIHQMREKLLENQQVDFIVNVANDAWFYPSSQADIHLWRTRWISAIYELPTVRVANGGISASIKWDGTIAESISYGSSGSKEIQPWYSNKARPIFIKWGLIPFILFSLLVWSLIEFRFKNIKNS
jgi:apolipoprotein N-acyltransferase